jgi:hypothetical protein
MKWHYQTKHKSIPLKDAEEKGSLDHVRRERQTRIKCVASSSNVVAAGFDASKGSDILVHN